MIRACSCKYDNQNELYDASKNQDDQLHEVLAQALWFNVTCKAYVAKKAVQCTCKATGFFTVMVEFI